MSAAFEPPLAGIVDDLDAAVYHASDGVSSSEIRRALVSPFHYRAHRDQPQAAAEPTPQMLAGTLAHAALLEPDAFVRRYAILPDDAPARPTQRQRNAARPSPATLDAIAWWSDWDERHPGVQLITVEQRDVALRQAEQVRGLSQVREMLTGARTERSAWCVHGGTGLRLKCRPDAVSEGWGPQGRDCILLDLKTTQDASRSAFTRSVVRYGYHVQDAHYRRVWADASGHAVLGLLFVVVESTFPYAAAVYALDDDALDAGGQQCERAVQTIAECTVSGQWPGYPDGVQTLSLPAWAFKE